MRLLPPNLSQLPYTWCHTTWGVRQIQIQQQRISQKAALAFGVLNLAPNKRCTWISFQFSTEVHDCSQRLPQAGLAVGAEHQKQAPLSAEKAARDLVFAAAICMRSSFFLRSAIAWHHVIIWHQLSDRWVAPPNRQNEPAEVGHAWVQPAKSDSVYHCPPPWYFYVMVLQWCFCCFAHTVSVAYFLSHLSSQARPWAYLVEDSATLAA